MQCLPHLLNGDMMHNLYTLLEEALEMYLSEIQDWSALTYKVHISKSALHQNIHDTGITFKLLCRAAVECDKDLRQEWKQDVDAHFTASQMVFVDETSKDD
jgi:transposase